MKIILKELSDTTPQAIVDSHLNTFRKKGKFVKTRHEGNLIQIYVEESFEN